MKKNKKTEQRTPANSERDWGPLFKAAREVIEWALDVATKLSREYPEDIDAIQRVREFALAWLDGRRGEVPVRDVLSTLAIIFAAIEIDTGVESVELLSPMKTFLDTPAVLPAVLRVSGAARDSQPTVIIRRPRRRNAPAFPFPLAA